MSRIHDILKKAEQEGTLRRTRGAGAESTATIPPMPAPTTLPRRSAPVPVAVMERAREHTPASEPGWAPQPAARLQLDSCLVAAGAPQSVAAEQYRSLRTRISRGDHGGAVRTIIVTSPLKGDGKSLTAANLALTMAQEFHQRVLLIDADLRQPTVHRLFGIADTPGLSDVLMGGVALEQALVEVPEHRLSLLPSGGPSSNPAELLGTVAMRRTLDTLRAKYDRIILDMPPVSPLADVEILLPSADGLVLIVRAGVTPRPSIEHALSRLDPAKVLGVVLNESDAAGSYGGYSYLGG